VVSRKNTLADDRSSRCIVAGSVIPLSPFAFPFSYATPRARARTFPLQGVLIQQVYNGGRVARILCKTGIALEPPPLLMFHKWSRNYSSRAYAERRHAERDKINKIATRRHSRTCPPIITDISKLLATQNARIHLRSWIKLLFN